MIMFFEVSKFQSYISKSVYPLSHLFLFEFIHNVSKSKLKVFPVAQRWSPPANAGDTGLRFDFWSGEIPYFVEHLISLCTTTIELVFQTPGSATTESMGSSY